MGLFRRVFDHGHPFCLHCGKHDVHRGADGNHIQIDVVPDQLVCGNIDHAPFQRIGGANRRKPFQMLIDGADPEIASARHGDNRMGKAAQKRAEKIVGAPDMACQFVRRHIGMDGSWVDFQRGLVDVPDLCPHIVQNSGNRGHIRNVRDIFDPADAIRKDGGRNNCNRGILCTADGYLTGQPIATSNYKFIQCGTLQS